MKEGLKYCETVYLRSGINHMCNIRSFKELLFNLKCRFFSENNSVKTFDIYPVYHHFPYEVGHPLPDMIHNAFQYKNCSIHYKCITIECHYGIFD